MPQDDILKWYSSRVIGQGNGGKSVIAEVGESSPSQAAAQPDPHPRTSSTKRRDKSRHGQLSAFDLECRAKIADQKRLDYEKEKK